MYHCYISCILKTIFPQHICTCSFGTKLLKFALFFYYVLFLNTVERLFETNGMMGKCTDWNASIHLHVYVMWNKFQQRWGEIVFIEVFMAHWHPVAVFMTRCARHTTKQPDSLKGIRTNQYRQRPTLIIQQDIFSEAYCWISVYTTAQVTSAQFYFHNGDNTWVGLNLHVTDHLVSDIDNNNLNHRS